MIISFWYSSDYSSTSHDMVRIICSVCHATGN